MGGKFLAESLAETRLSKDRRRLEITFVDAEGSTQTVSLPSRVALELVPVIESQVPAVEAGGPQFTKRPKHCTVGRARYERLVLLKFDDDPPYALDIDDAEALWRGVCEETESVSRLEKPALQ
jgi:hypothetical protein